MVRSRSAVRVRTTAPNKKTAVKTVVFLIDFMGALCYSMLNKGLLDFLKKLSDPNKFGLLEHYKFICKI